MSNEAVHKFEVLQKKLIPNTKLWCFELKKTREVKDLKAEECLKCPKHFENGGSCNPVH